MAGSNELELRMGRVEEKVDALAQSVDTAFGEQREYTEFAFGRLAAEMRESFGHVDAQFSNVNAQFSNIDAQFRNVDMRFNNVDARFDRLEQKLDQFIDTQSRTNSLVERRLERLERPSATE